MFRYNRGRGNDSKKMPKLIMSDLRKIAIIKRIHFVADPRIDCDI